MSVRIPKYRLHKPTSQALVEIRGKRIYLGKHGTPESKEKYRRIIAEFVCNDGGDPMPAIADSPLTVNMVILRYFRFAKTYYVKNGKPTDEIAALRAIFRRLKSLYGNSPAADLGPKAFKTLRESLIREDLSRKYINDCMGRVRRMFRWAAAEELVPPEVYQSLAAVGGLRRGRSKARETDPIKPVSDLAIESTLPHLPEVVADMVRLQRLTGMRPAEVCLLRPCDLSRDGEVWIYSPSTHKTEHKSKLRQIPIGPRAQAILLKYLARNAEARCFQPRDSEARRRRQRHDQRKTPPMVGNVPNSNRVRQPKREPGEKYTTASYRRAIQRARRRAFPPADDLSSDELREWDQEHRWSPNQLRHTAATEIRKMYGLEAAQVVLGHSAADVTQIYAERDLNKGLEIAQRIG